MVCNDRVRGKYGDIVEHMGSRAYGGLRASVAVLPRDHTSVAPTAAGLQLGSPPRPRTERHHFWRLVEEKQWNSSSISARVRPPNTQNVEKGHFWADSV